MYAPIRLHPDNPRYFLFRGRPTVLLTSGEHYGAVINLDFDYRAYLDSLRDRGFNLTRLFSGAYVEREESIHWMGYRNTLAPRPKRFLAPWARSSQPGYAVGGMKFDLDQWDGDYFARLKDFVAEAGKRGIVVEFVFFSQMYNEQNWSASPLNAANNVNDVGAIPWERFTTLQDAALFERQAALVRKVAHELNDFDNVYYEICNEPNYIGAPGGTADWHDRLIQVLTETEASLPNRHMIAVDYDQEALFPRLNPLVSVHNVHYAFGSGWVGALELLERFPDAPRALAFDETTDPIWGNTLTGNRLEAWEFILGGGAVYDHLNWAYTPEDPAGARNETGRELCRQLSILGEFIRGFEIASMKPNCRVVAGGLSPGIRARVLAEAGRQYAIYLYHASRTDHGYDLHPGAYRAEPGLDLPAGRYGAVWIEPATGRSLAEECFVHAGGHRWFPSPVFAADIALKIVCD